MMRVTLATHHLLEDIEDHCERESLDEKCETCECNI